MRPSSSASARTRHLVTSAAAGALVLAACSGGSDDAASGADSGDTPPAVTAATEAASTDEAAAPIVTGQGLLDLVGPEVTADADTEVNQLPDVVVDDLLNGRKVNFRNLVPQDKPILLWMWAPH